MLRQSITNALEGNAAHLGTLAEVIPFPARAQASAFEAVEITFNAPNDAWARSNRPMVRAAVAIMRFDSVRLEQHWREIDSPEQREAAILMLQEWDRVGNHLLSLAEIIVEADRRARHVLARMGASVPGPSAA